MHGLFDKTRRWAGLKSRERRRVVFVLLLFVGLLRTSTARVKDTLEITASTGVVAVEDLVIVPSHAVYVISGHFQAEDAQDDSRWISEPHHEGQARSFIEHMKLAVDQVASNPEGMLIFSGGKTRRAAKAMMSEASSYWHVSRAFRWFGADVSVESRIFTEEYAQDSFENLLFSICRFYELAKKFPRRITVIDFESKRARFEQLHLSALRFPRKKFTYIGHGDRIVKTDLGEVNSLSNLFQRDPYGCRGELAAKKKLERDPFNEGAPYSSRITILNGLWIHIATCSQRIYTGALPW